MKRACAILLLLVLVVVASSCNKTPEPNPNQPTDTITPNDTITPTDTITPGDTIPPVVPTREIVIPWAWGAGEGFAPKKDTIEFYAKDPTVKYVFIYLMPIQNFESTWEPRHFKRSRDTLQTRLDIDPEKVHGQGIVKVGKDGAHIHPDTLTQKFGMWEPDSIWFATNGWRVERYNH